MCSCYKLTPSIVVETHPEEPLEEVVSGRSSTPLLNAPHPAEPTPAGRSFVPVRSGVHPRGVEVQRGQEQSEEHGSHGQGTGAASSGGPGVGLSAGGEGPRGLFKHGSLIYQTTAGGRLPVLHKLTHMSRVADL